MEDAKPALLPTPAVSGAIRPKMPDLSVGGDIHHAAMNVVKDLELVLDPGHLGKILLAAFMVDRERGG